MSLKPCKVLSLHGKIKISQSNLDFILVAITLARGKYFVHPGKQKYGHVFVGEAIYFFDRLN